MERIIKNKMIVLLGLFVVFTSCSDFLSELPDNRTIIDTPDKVSDLLINAYPEGNYMLMAELMSDNAMDKGLFDRTDDLDLDMFSWKTSSQEYQDSPVGYWNSCYEAISQSNQALVSIEELKSKYNMGAHRGEALITRAYAHFMLVNLWAKHYDVATANSDLGIPYVLEPETVLLKKYKRKTVGEVYDLIEKDIIEGLALIQNSYNEPKFHFTKEASNAFAARFYLYKGDWDKVIKHANKAVNNTSLIRNTVEVSALSYSQIANLYASASEKTNLLVASTSSLWARKFAGSRFGLTFNLADQLFFSSGNSNPVGKPWAYGVYGSEQVYNLPKYDEYFKYTNQSAGIGRPYLGIVLFDRDEALLNRAEAYAMKGNYASALSDMDAFLSYKTRSYDVSTDALTKDIIIGKYPVVIDEFTPFYSLDSDQTSFIKAISSFKQREYYHEGLRWFDVKRFHIVVEHELLDGAVLTLNKQDNRRLLQIPQPAIDFGLQANPRD